MTDDWLRSVGRRALSSFETVRASYDIAKLAIERGIPGDFVECGVFAGVQSAAMVRAIMVANISGMRNADGTGFRQVHLFDSFEGLPDPGDSDEQFIASGIKRGTSSCSLSAVKGHMAEWGIPPELLVYYPGWFHQTVPQAAREMAVQDKRIAVLRLDADLYESTKICMEHFYPLLSRGGWLIVDDFALAGCRKAVDEYLAYPPAYFVKESD